jgi:hypothetical protein
MEQLCKYRTIEGKTTNYYYCNHPEVMLVTDMNICDKLCKYKPVSHDPKDVAREIRESNKELRKKLNSLPPDEAKALATNMLIDIGICDKDGELLDVYKC